MIVVHYLYFLLCSEEVYSPEELLGMIFNSSRQIAEDYAGNSTHHCTNYLMTVLCVVLLEYLLKQHGFVVLIWY